MGQLSQSGVIGSFQGVQNGLALFQQRAVVPGIQGGGSGGQRGGGDVEHGGRRLEGQGGGESLAHAQAQGSAQDQGEQTKGHGLFHRIFLPLGSIHFSRWERKKQQQKVTDRTRPL